MPVWAWVLIVVLLIVLVVCIFASRYFFYMACPKVSKFFSSNNNGDEKSSPWKECGGRHEKLENEIKAMTCQDVTIMSGDGLHLHACYYPKENAKRAVVCAHGFHGTGTGDFAGIFAYLYQDSSVLLIDERCCGKSEGEWITFGAKESDDVLLWTSWLDKTTEHKLPIYLHGISMGASTVLICSAMKLPKSVKGVIADCGYSSMQDECASLAKRWFHIPPYPVVWFVDLWCRIKAHFSMYEADAAKALKHASVPVLFIHGDKDDFVRPENSQKNYDACTSKKKIVWIKDATHAMSSMKDPEKYTEAFHEFFVENEAHQ